MKTVTTKKKNFDKESHAIDDIDLMMIDNIDIYSKSPVAGVDSMLNSATDTPRYATCGANMAAG